MNEQQLTAAPTAEDFFEICLQMLAAAQSLHETTLKQADEMRFAAAELKTELAYLRQSRGG